MAVLCFGAVKYGKWNWRKGIMYMRIWDAIQRHTWAWRNGEDNDPETGYSHIAHVVVNCLFLLFFIKEGRTELDDRDGS